MTIATLTKTLPKPKVFPAIEVEALLRNELIEAVKAELLITNAAPSLSNELIANTGIQVDSLLVVAILCAVEPIMGEIPASVVRAGGYSSVENAIKHLMPGLEQIWKKQ